jgi:hypothetical protein
MRLLSLFLLVAGFTVCCANNGVAANSATKLERVMVSADGKGFQLEQSHKAFRAWGMNYGNDGRLMEDFWDKDWATFAGDFKELKEMGANVIRVHLQYGKFMLAADKPNPAAFQKLDDMLRLAEQTGIYLDITGLACYRPSDTPTWYDAMTEAERWPAQAFFWATVAKHCKGSTAVFCYDLINEPLSPADKRAPGKWPSGSNFGGFDFLQCIALDPAGRSREEIVRQWIQMLKEAIRKEDQKTMITVGLLPWSRQWKHLSGFVPEKVAEQVDFISVHIYPDKKLPEGAMEALKVCVVGKPVVIEETFPLDCDAPQMEAFFRESKSLAAGWVGHYDGDTLKELDALEKKGRISGKQLVYRSWLQSFVKLRPEFAP